MPPPVLRGHRSPSLQAHLARLVLVVAAPLVLLAGAEVYTAYQDARHREEAGLVDRARVGALVIDREFARAEAMLKGLAASTSLANGELDRFHAEMKAAASASGTGPISLRREGGMPVMDSAQPPDLRNDTFHGAPGVLATLAGARVRISDLQTGPGVDRPQVRTCVEVARPEPGQRLGYDLCVGLPVDVFARALAEQHLPPGAVAAAIDRTLHVVARSRLNERFAGSAVIPPVRAAMMAGPEGAVHTATVENVPSTIAFARAPQSGYAVALAVPDETYLAPLRQAMRRTFAVGGAIAATGLLVALLVAGRITASLARIAQLAVGRAPSGPGLRETDVLVTALGQAMAARDRAMAELQTMFEASPVGVCRAGFDGRVHTANDAYLRLMGASRAELEAGQVRWDERTPPEWLPGDEAAIAEAIERGKCTPYEKEILRPDGQRVPVMIAFAVLEQGSGLVAAYVVDLTEIHTQRAALHESEASLRLALDSAAMGAWAAGEDGRFEATASAKALHCLPPDAPLDHARALAAVHPDDRAMVASRLEAAWAGTGLFEAELRVLQPDGSLRWLATRGRCVEHPGRQRRLLGVVQDITARKQADADRERHLAAIEAERGRFAILIEHMPVGVGLFDAEGRVLLSNAAWEACLGKPGCTIPSRVPPAERGEWIGVDADGRHLEASDFPGARALRGEVVRDVEMLHRPPDGPKCWYRASAMPLRDAAGAVTGGIGVVLDIDAAKRAEQKLRESEARMQALYAGAPVGLCFLDRALRYVSTNQRLAELNGLPVEAHLGRGLAEALPALAPAVEPLLRRALAGEPVLDVVVRGAVTPGDEHVWLASYYPARDESGAVFGVSVAVIDITERQRAEDALRESETRLALAQRAAGIGSWETDLRTGRILISAESYRLWDIPADATLRQELFLSRVHPEDRPGFMAAWQLADTQGVVSDLTFRIVLADGSIRWLSTVGETVRAGSGEALRVIGVTQDITSRKRFEQDLLQLNAGLEARVAARTAALSDAAHELAAEMRRREQAQASLLQAQKMEALGRLTGGIAHDMNNVLAAVVGHYELIQHRSTDPRVRGFAEKGLQASERAAALVRRLVAFARQEDLRPATIQLPALLKGLAGIVPHSVGPRVRVAFEAAEDIWPVLADARALEVALINLLVNARDAMPEGGEVQVTAANVADPQAVPAPLRPGGCVAIRVRDSGTGMPPEVLARATEPFFTTKPRGKGTGLGLAMVDGLMAQLGGVLRIDSEPGKGTSVELLLPRAAAEFAAADVAPAGPERGRHGAAVILLVDDDEQVRGVTATLPARARLYRDRSGQRRGRICACDDAGHARPGGDRRGDAGRRRHGPGCPVAGGAARPADAFRHGPCARSRRIARRDRAAKAVQGK